MTPDASMLRELVTSLPNPLLMALRQSLPRYIDDVERTIGADVYEQMLRDPQVAADFNTLRLSVLSEGFRVAPAVEMPTGDSVPAEVEAQANEAAEFVTFIERAIKRMKTPFMVQMFDMLRGIAYGNRVGEIVLDFALSGEDAGKLVLMDIRPKPKKHIGFVMDPVGTLVGIVGVQPAEGMTALPEVFSLSSEDMAKVLPVGKFIVFTHDMQDGLPTGTAVLRPAYNPWFVKKNIVPDYFKFLRQFGTPSIIGKAGSEQVSAVNKATGEILESVDGNPMVISAVWDLLQTLLAFQNSVALAVPKDTEIDVVESRSDGQAFAAAFTFLNSEISKAILGTAQVSLEAQHESRSSKAVGQDVLGLRVSWYRFLLGVSLQPMVRLLIEQNFGADKVDLAPMVVFTRVEQQDKAALIEAYSRAKASGLVIEPQLKRIWEECGMPIPTEEEMAAWEQKQHDEMVKRQDMSKVIDPVGNPSDRQAA